MAILTKIVHQLYIPEFLEPLMSKEEASGPLVNRRGLFEVVENVGAELAVCGQCRMVVGNGHVFADAARTMRPSRD